jgi:hypothetical protein
LALASNAEAAWATINLDAWTLIAISESLNWVFWNSAIVLPNCKNHQQSFRGWFILQWTVFICLHYAFSLASALSHILAQHQDKIGHLQYCISR